MIEYDYKDREAWVLHNPTNIFFERIDQLEARIERLEGIIMRLDGGSETSPPDDGNSHTHWVYPLNGAQDLVDEIATERAAEAFAQEEYERQIDEYAEARWQREHGEYGGLS